MFVEPVHYVNLYFNFLRGETMSSEESITLTAAKHDKLGAYHCDVPHAGRVSVAGEPRDINDGESVYFERSNITAIRSGDEYTFIRGQAEQLAKAS